jgi:hypothetical protein
MKRDFKLEKCTNDSNPLDGDRSSISPQALQTIVNEFQNQNVSQ